MSWVHLILSILPIQSVKDPSIHTGIGFCTRVTAPTKGFNFRIYSLLESMGLRLTWLDCNVLSF